MTREEALVWFKKRKECLALSDKCAKAEEWAIRALEKYPEWVSVQDRLPKIGEVVLAFGTRSATTGMFQGTMPDRPNVWMWKNHTPKHVSHWMPLPEPPMREDDDET